MPASRITDILGKPPPTYASHLEREGSWLGAVKNAYMLDTSIGQATMMYATANAFGVRMQPMYRRIQEGYSPFDSEQEDLTGYESFFDEFSRSTSPEETAMIKQMIENNLDLRTSLEDWGGTRLATGFLDPINLIPVPFALGKGFAEGAKVALKRGVPIVAGTELVRHAIDPTSTAEETIFATLGGGLFMGLIGGAVGKIPKDTMTVGAALGKLTPPPGTTSMSLGIPMRYGGSPKGMFRKATRALKSAVSYGDHKSKQYNPERIKVREDFDNPDVAKSIVVDVDDEAVITATKIGNKIKIENVLLPPEKRGLGLGTASYKALIKYAEDNGLKVYSDMAVSADAVKVWRNLEDEGYNIKQLDDADVKIHDDGAITSKDHRPVFEVLEQLDPDGKQIPTEIREAIEEMELAAKEANAKIALHDRYIKELKLKATNQKKKVNKAVVAGGAKTKAKAKLNEINAEIRDALKNRKGFEEDAMLAHRNAQDINIKALALLDSKTVKDWDLLPTGYNTILGKLDQFPWWRLIKTPLRDVAPDLAVEYQMFALKIASTPGLNNKGNKLGHNVGPSVESASIIHTGRWLSATREAQNIYRKYTGHGQTSGQIKHFVIDQTQRVRGSLNKIATGEKSKTTSDGFLTIEEFDTQISVAIANGAHEVPEVMEAASHYIRALKELGDEGKKLGVYATQKNIARRIAKVDQQLDEFDKRWSAKYKKDPLPPALQNQKDNLTMERVELEDLAEAYRVSDNPSFIHRMWIAEEVKAKEVELKNILTRHFEQTPKRIIKDSKGNVVREDPEIIRGRVNEAYASILHEADTGNNGAYAPQDHQKRPWLEGRKAAIEDGSFRDAQGALSPKAAKTQLEIIDRKLERIANGDKIGGASGPLIARRLDLDDAELIGLNLIESNVNTWMQHYVSRTAPMIETARIFGDARAQQHIHDLHQKVFQRGLDAEAAGDTKAAKVFFDEAEGGLTAMNDLRDIVHGVWQIPDNPDAITPRILRMLRNFNILGAMGRSVMMALGDIGNVVASQGFARSLGYAFENFGSGLADGNIKMIRTEVDLAGSVSEVILGMRYHQMTDFGTAVGSSKYPGLAKIEKGLANASQRFFLYNLLGPWTDMARRFSGGMLQSRLIENSLLWRAGNLSDDEITIMNRLGINEKQAIQFAEEWEASGSLKHGAMYIANTSEWVSEQGTRTFRAALNTEINRMVPTPGAVDKPKALLKSDWWKVIGQYRGFSMAATHRIMGAGIHQKGAQKYSGLASMVGIAFMVDAFKRPDYIQLPLEEQILRAVELSAVTGIILDLNDTIERMTAGGVGVRPMFGMDIRERNPNWANRMGTLGAVPNQWMTLMYGLTADEAETDDLARAIRYMIPYNNLLWWNEAFTRAQRASVDFIEDKEQ